MPGLGGCGPQHPPHLRQEGQAQGVLPALLMNFALGCSQTISQPHPSINAQHPHSETLWGFSRAAHNSSFLCSQALAGLLLPARLRCWSRCREMCPAAAALRSQAASCPGNTGAGGQCCCRALCAAIKNIVGNSGHGFKNWGKMWCHSGGAEPGPSPCRGEKQNPDLAHAEGRSRALVCSCAARIPAEHLLEPSVGRGTGSSH